MGNHRRHQRNIQVTSRQNYLRKFLATFLRYNLAKSHLLNLLTNQFLILQRNRHYFPHRDHLKVHHYNHHCSHLNDRQANLHFSLSRILQEVQPWLPVCSLPKNLLAILHHCPLISQLVILLLFLQHFLLYNLFSFLQHTHHHNHNTTQPCNLFLFRPNSHIKFQHISHLLSQIVVQPFIHLIFHHISLYCGLQCSR